MFRKYLRKIKNRQKRKLKNTAKKTIKAATKRLLITAIINTSLVSTVISIILYALDII